MKTLQLRITDDEHLAIKINATKHGQSMKQFVMNCIDNPQLMQMQVMEPIVMPRLQTAKVHSKADLRAGSQKLCVHGYNLMTSNCKYGCKKA